MELAKLSQEVTFTLMEYFLSVQGEGKNAGKAAHFIRLGGCDVGCTWCDVKESWQKDKHPGISEDEILALLENSHVKNVVITGGEPCMYNLQSLTEKLQQNGFQTWLETSGAYPITGTWNWIVVSPKKFKKPLSESLQMANELKVVVCNHHDLRWAQENAAFTSQNAELYVQPEWSRAKKVHHLLVDFVIENPNWKISLQTHNYLEIR